MQYTLGDAVHELHTLASPRHLNPGDQKTKLADRILFSDANTLAATLLPPPVRSVQ